MKPTTVEGVIRERLGTAMGGWRGSLEAALPTVAFAIVWTATHNLNNSLIAAGGVLVIALLLRLIQRSTVRFVLAAAFATAFAAFLAHRSGKASDVSCLGCCSPAGCSSLQSRASLSVGPWWASLSLRGIPTWPKILSLGAAHGPW